MFSEKDNTLPIDINCFLKSSTRTHREILFLSESHTHTLNTGWYNYGS